jgi:hypothetical protein
MSQRSSNMTPARKLEVDALEASIVKMHVEIAAGHRTQEFEFKANRTIGLIGDGTAPSNALSQNILFQVIGKRPNGEPILEELALGETAYPWVDPDGGKA